MYYTIHYAIPYTISNNINIYNLDSEKYCNGNKDAVASKLSNIKDAF